MHGASLIALDWGTSNLRASLLGDGGRLIETRSAPGGVMAVADRRFEAVLLALCGDWIAATGCALIASGMIGSRQGWQEAPYVDCPAGLQQAAERLTRIPLSDGGTLHIVPGLRYTGSDGQDDVMRGEETQLWGALLPDGSCSVLPGTHAKWAWMGEAGEVQAFQTFMTGELYALLTKHGILGRLMDFGSDDADAFAHGVRLGLAEHARATHVIFSARTAGLMNHLPAASLPDFLSGMLVGIEIAGATHDVKPAEVTVIGDDALSTRYVAALTIAGIAAHRAPAEVTTRGQWRVAAQAGLVEDSE